MPIFEILAPFDLSVLRFMNLTASHPWLDQFWLTVTQLHKLGVVRYAVAPTILALLFWRFGVHALKPLAMVALGVGLCDLVSYRLIKNNVGRPRPYENPRVAEWVRPVGKASGSSFPSNHSANMFAAAGVLGWYFHRRRNLFYAFAMLVALSRIALGVHYPTDVLAGMVIGATTAFFVNALIVSQYKWLWMPADGVRGFGPNGPTSGRTLRT